MGEIIFQSRKVYIGCVIVTRLVCSNPSVKFSSVICRYGGKSSFVNPNTPKFFLMRCNFIALLNNILGIQRDQFTPEMVFYPNREMLPSLPLSEV